MNVLVTYVSRSHRGQSPLRSEMLPEGNRSEMS